MKRLIYLAYPIDNAQLTENQIAWINGGKARLLGNDQNPAVAVYDPGDAFLVRHGAEPGPEITTINEAAIDAADGVLAFAPRGVASIGVPMEIARAALFSKPVAVVSDSYSWALRSNRGNVRIFGEDDLQGAVEWLLNVEIGADAPADREPLPVVGGDGGFMPTRAHSDDAGLDLYVSQDTELPFGQFVDVPCGVKVELPDWSWGLLVGRSSTFRRRQIEVQPGIIDAGYRGELFAACIWRPERLMGVDRIMNDRPVTVVKAGDRLAQLIVLPNGTRDVEPVPVVALSAHERGENGFGSSGA